MNYELCKTLQDAGFPQKEHVLDDKTASCCVRCSYMESYTQTHPHGGVDGMCVTLSELIEACGDVVLYTKDGKSVAWVSGNMRPNNPIEYNTPEESVAKLWLALNKK